ncbi:uncharacterized protein LOC116432081 isoform X2 [Nomia melanderi]|uniref:uncharacterized protein LOC116432081 isoform X2 n=1 Tax=Nomia melanderi TaxID=2448451 RepID=UPI0013046B74|nr:uncharacterized protein LOC116432081 isoform X2 [Nomia melanderi]
MSALNDSVIICDASPNSSRKKTSPKKKKQKKIPKRTFYEGPLKHIQLSKRYKQLQVQQNLNDRKKEIDNNENNFFSSEIAGLTQDNIIILSDNECESTSADNENVRKHKGDVQKRFLDEVEKTIMSYKNINASLKRKRPGVMTRSKKRKLLNSGVLLDNNSSCLLISDTEDSDVITVEVDGENRAPLDSVNQSSDDIVVVWSSASTTLPDVQTKENIAVNTQMKEHKVVNAQTKENKGVIEGRERETLINSESDQGEIVSQKEQGTETPNQEKDNRLFMIDRTPDAKNLQCLLLSRKERSKISKDNFEEDIPNNDSQLLFNKPGLTLPTAQNISGRIIMKKRRSLFNTLSRLEDKASDVDRRTPLPSTSIENSASNIDVPPTNVNESIDTPRTQLREIIVDGNNVAMAHSKSKQFSEEGIQIVIDYFRQRGHTVKVFVPQYRRSLNNPRLEKWYAEGIVIFTPSRYIAGRWITSYDDRFILQYATMCKGIVISMDQYRDLYAERLDWRDTILNRLLAPTFVGNIVMFPDDPLGRKGPTLDEFLRYKVYDFNVNSK